MLGEIRVQDSMFPHHRHPLTPPMTIDLIHKAVADYEARHGISNFHIAAALIDMDGVLYDSMKYHTLAWHRMISEQGIECTREEFYLYEGMTGKATINLLFERVYGRSASDEEVQTLYEQKAKYFVEIGRKEMMPGATQMLRVLMDHDITRVLVTGSAQNSLIRYIDEDYPGAFDPQRRITALDVKHGKPNPEPYLMGLQKAATPHTSTIVIENAPLGVESGHAAGCFTIGITTGPIPAEELKKAGADLVFDSMQDFADTLPLILDITASR